MGKVLAIRAEHNCRDSYAAASPLTGPFTTNGSHLSKVSRRVAIKRERGTCLWNHAERISNWNGHRCSSSWVSRYGSLWTIDEPFRAISEQIAGLKCRGQQSECAPPFPFPSPFLTLLRVINVLGLSHFSANTWKMNAPFCAGGGSNELLL